MIEIPCERIRAWMFDAALPLWGRSGVDHECGGYREELDLVGCPTPIGFKRTRVICRQVYVFSHAAILGWARGAELAAFGQEYLFSKAWLGSDRGWARRLSRAGEVIDATPDLYDLAFVLFALGWRYRQSRDPEALTRAHQTLDFIQTHMRRGEGFAHEMPPHGPRRQNPHMHLLEASIALFEASVDQRFLDQAREIVTLFQTRFFDGLTLGEYFTDNWARAPGGQGCIVEPGHQFEWAWILERYQRFAGVDVTRSAQALVAFAEQHGVDPATQLTFNQVRDDGAVLDRGSRTWSNTERIKGHLALFELTGADPRMAVASSVRALFDRHLNVNPHGLWIDNFDAAGQPNSKAVPASTLYHVFLAFAEVLRLQARLKAAFD